ncbi:patatin-like phospholipase family protein [Robertkochia solimangrovi]|uniref:patatin-like phospholipase family protein n=1 Tax=Robertkochia solimangrovi TaxID=2213046 RepID=UPI00117E5B54|nr:patatin-like phospholipase family protein [Robertkochia solimangrovi]TRZ45046.1 alpha/beta hydrolase [Robertkochia solimangrovi]
MKSDFLKTAGMDELIAEAVRLKESGRIVSDIYDDEGNQYVDLVQEGGGMLGIALTGYTYILEQAGIRFYSLAGTSAGSINTLLMAALAKPGEVSSLKILDIVSNKNFFDFVDGPSGLKRLIQRKIENKKGVWWYLLVNLKILYDSIRLKLGINPGKHFEDWLSDILKQNSIENLRDLNTLRKDIPRLFHRLDPDYRITPPKMAIITSEITTHTKVDFPEMAPLYWRDPENICPSRFIRASMSIPFFFYPYEVQKMPNAGKHDEQWEKLASYTGKVPETVRFVDGGMLSNFPINTFHVNRIPTRPTFGVRLSTYRENYSNNTHRLTGFCGALISTMRQIHDYEFILKNTDYKHLICCINADEEFNWLNFGMKPERQQQLFFLGAKRGLDFIKNFDWEGYKKIRASMVEAEKVT